MIDDNVNWAQLLGYLTILYHHVLLAWLSLHKYKILVRCGGARLGFKSSGENFTHVYT